MTFNLSVRQKSMRRARTFFQNIRALLYPLFDDSLSRPRPSRVGFNGVRSAGRVESVRERLYIDIYGGRDGKEKKLRVYTYAWPDARVQYLRGFKFGRWTSGRISVGSFKGAPAVRPSWMIKAPRPGKGARVLKSASPGERETFRNCLRANVFRTKYRRTSSSAANK